MIQHLPAVLIIVGQLAVSTFYASFVGPSNLSGVF
jgi:hypothetical protein